MFVLFNVPFDILNSPILGALETNNVNRRVLNTHSLIRLNVKMITNTFPTIHMVYEDEGKSYICFVFAHETCHDFKI